MYWINNIRKTIYIKYNASYTELRKKKERFSEMKVLVCLKIYVKDVAKDVAKG